MGSGSVHTAASRPAATRSASMAALSSIRSKRVDLLEPEEPGSAFQAGGYHLRTSRFSLSLANSMTWPLASVCSEEVADGVVGVAP